MSGLLHDTKIFSNQPEPSVTNEPAHGPYTDKPLQNTQPSINQTKLQHWHPTTVCLGPSVSIYVATYITSTGRVSETITQLRVNPHFFVNHLNLYVLKHTVLKQVTPLTTDNKLTNLFLPTIHGPIRVNIPWTSQTMAAGDPALCNVTSHWLTAHHIVMHVI